MLIFFYTLLNPFATIAGTKHILGIHRYTTIYRVRLILYLTWWCDVSNNLLYEFFMVVQFVAWRNLKESFQAQSYKDQLEFLTNSSLNSTQIRLLWCHSQKAPQINFWLIWRKKRYLHFFSLLKILFSHCSAPFFDSEKATVRQKLF